MAWRFPVLGSQVFLCVLTANTSCATASADSSPLAKIVGGVIMFLIFAGSVSFVVETVPSVRQSKSAMDITGGLELVCIACFTIDYLGRAITCSSRPGPDKSVIRYLIRPLNLIDFLSIAPFYAELFLNFGAGSFAILRMLRMARIFRILKVGSMARDLQLFSSGMARALPGLELLSFLLLICASFVALLIWIAAIHCLHYHRFGCVCFLSVLSRR